VGTGFIIDSEGTIVTNNHVVSGARRVVVTLFDGRTYEAEIVGLDAQTDLAVLRIPETGLQPVALGSSTALEVGEPVVAIGHALDLPGGPTVTTGVVSAKDRTITNVGTTGLTLSGLIQTDASINPGNSGGPLVNRYAEVVGINTVAAGSAQDIGFAIALDVARPLVETLIAQGRIERGFLGIQGGTITRSIARQSQLPVETGIYILAVVPDSPAEAAGLQADDILVAIDEEPVPDAGTLSRVLAKHAPGAAVTLSVLRPGESGPIELGVTLGTAPTS
jgi:S1-C subfamily serine protease